MKYKGFVIEPVYVVGSEWREVNERIISRKPTPKDIAHYEVLDPMEGMNVFCKDFSIREAKKSVDQVLDKMKLKNNSPEEWEKLGD